MYCRDWRSPRSVEDMKFGFSQFKLIPSAAGLELLHNNDRCKNPGLQQCVIPFRTKPKTENIHPSSPKSKQSVTFAKHLCNPVISSPFPPPIPSRTPLSPAYPSTWVRTCSPRTPTHIRSNTMKGHDQSHPARSTSINRLTSTLSVASTTAEEIFLAPFSELRAVVMNHRIVGSIAKESDKSNSRPRLLLHRPGETLMMVTSGIEVIRLRVAI